MLKYVWIGGVVLGIVSILLCVFLDKSTPIISTIFAAIPTVVVLVAGIIVFKNRGDKK